MLSTLAGIGPSSVSAARADADALRAPWRTTEDDARLARYKRHLDFDAGRHDVGRLGIGGTPLVANYARVFVRKGASFLLPAPVTLSVTAPPTAPDPAAVAARAERALHAVAQANDLPAVDLATAIDAGVLGDGAFKVTWDGDDAQVRIVAVDPQTLFVESAPDDVHRVRAVRHVARMAWTHITALWNVHPVGRDEYATVIEHWTDNTYTVTVERATVHDGPNPYGMVPYVIFPNAPRPHEFWGDSDLTDLIEINRALDRRLSVLAQILELSGNPVTVLENVSGSQGVNISPGALWELPPDSRAYLLDLLAGGSVDQHLRYIEALYRVMDDLAEMPRMSFGEAAQARSGVALQVQLQPVIQRTARKRLIWSSAIERRARMALRLLHAHGGLDLDGLTPDDFALRAIWTPILPSDRQATVADEIALYEAGLHSQKLAMETLGVRDPDAEAHRIATGPPSPVTPRPLSLGVPTDGGGAPKF